MKYHSFIRKIILLAVLVNVGCSNSDQTIGENRQEEQMGKKDYVSLWQIAYVADLEELVCKSDSILVHEGFPFFYALEHTGTINFYCTSNKKKRLVLQQTDLSQYYISEIYKVDCLDLNFFVIFVTEDITVSYRCIVVPSDNTITYISDLFFMDDDVIKVDNISINKDTSSMRISFVKDGLTDSNFVDVTLSKSADNIVLE